MVLTGCDISPGARKKKREERWQKGRVFAEVRILENPRSILWARETDPGFKFEVYRQSQARLMTSPFVLQAALRKPEIASLGLLKNQSKPLDWLEENLVVDFPASEFIRISMKTDQRVDAAKLVNAVVDAYLEEIWNAELVHRQTRHRELNKALDDLQLKTKSKMAKLRRLAEETASENKSDAPQFQALLKFRELATDELAREELARAKDQVQVAVLKAASRSEGDSPGGTEVATPPDLAWLESSITERSIRIEEWRRILDANVNRNSTTGIHSLELKSIEGEIEESMAITKQIRDELTRLDLEDQPEGRVTLFRKAMADQKP